MFGVLKNAGCPMAPSLERQWRGHLCGLCLSLKKQYGQFARIVTNYDAALLSALYVAQLPQGQRRQPSFCILRKAARTEVVAPDDPGIQYAASMALLMAASKIKDHIEDNETALRHIKGIATGLADKWMRMAGKGSAALGFAAAEVERQVQRQAVVESQHGRDFNFYAEPTELAVAAAFSHTAVLSNCPENKDTLYRMGQMFGRIMYLLDSYQDYAEDLVAHQFNALAASCAEEWRAEAVRLFQQAYRELDASFYALELSQPVLLQALLGQKLRQKGLSSLQICKESCRLGKRDTKKKMSWFCDCCYCDCDGCDPDFDCCGCEACNCCEACDCSC